MSNPAPEQPQQPGQLLWMVPLLSFSLLCIALGLPAWWQAMDFDPWPIGWMRLYGTILALLIAGWLLVWFFALTRTTRPTKWKVAGVLVLLIAGFLSVFEFDAWDANLRPIFRFRWQKSHKQRHREYLEGENEEPSGLPKIDLTIDK